MNTRIFFAIYILLLSFIAVTNQAFAVCIQNPLNTFTCDTTPPNPDLTGIQQDLNNNNLIVNMLPGSEIDTTAASTTAIELGNGNNQITLNGANVRALDDNGIQSGSGGGNGNNTVSINDSEVRCDDDCIDLLGTGNSNVSIFRSRIISIDNNAVNTDEGDDTIIAVDSEILAGPQCCNNFGINTRGGEDRVTILNTRVAGFIDAGTPFAIRTGDQNDTVTLGTGARIDGLIDCGEGFDTVVFAMEVPQDSLAFISSELASKNPAGDSIAINGLLYQWEFCEELVNELSGVTPIANVPALSEWGLIAMACLLGIVGFIVVHRRKVAA